jgi:hypothetical protein
MTLKKILIVVATLGAVLALGLFIWSSMRAVTARADAISQDVIARYVDLIQRGRYREAWDSCLAKTLQEATPVEAFVAAHEAHARELGDLEGWEQTRYDHEADLFSSESLIGIRGVLSYARRDAFVLYQVDSSVEPYRIQAIFGSTGASTSLSEGTW